MAENDAEWFDVDTVTRRPEWTTRPRSTTIQPPTTITTRYSRTTIPSPRSHPRVRPRIRPGRPRSTPPPGDIGDSSESKSTTIIIAVCSTVAILLIIGALLAYLVILRKRLMKSKEKQKRSEFSLRVEDISHLDLNESENIYENTAEIQLLFQSLRKKKQKKESLSLPDQQNSGSRNIGYSPSPKPRSSLARPSVPPPSAPEIVEKNDTGVNSYTVTRKAPPPPTKSKTSNSSSVEVLPVPSCDAELTLHASPKTYMHESSSSMSTMETFASTPPQVNFLKNSPRVPTLPKPTLFKDPPDFLSGSPKSKSPSTLQKPYVPPKPVIQKPLTSVPSGVIAYKGGIKLPPLNVSMLPFSRRGNSEFSTPDTATSYLEDSDQESKSESNPDAMTVAYKKALIEAMMKSGS